MSEPMERAREEAWERDRVRLVHRGSTGSWVEQGPEQIIQPDRTVYDAGFAAGYEAHGAALKEWRDAAEAEADGLDEWQRAAGRERKRAEEAEAKLAALEAEAERAGALREAVARIASCPGWINSNPLAWQKCRPENQWLDDDPDRCYHGRLVGNCEQQCPARIAFRALAADPARETREGEVSPAC